MPQKHRQLRETLDRHKACILRRRFRPQPQHRPRHDAERPFRTDEHLLQVVSGIVLDELVHRRHHRAVGKHDFKSQHHVARHPVTDDAVAAGIGGNVAADGRRAARPEIERKHQPLGFRRLAHRLQHAARLHAHRTARRVDLLDLVHAFERQRDMALRLAAFDKPGLAAPRHHALTRCMAELQRLRNLFGRCGSQHGRRHTELAPAPCAFSSASLPVSTP